jgi:hypothetical protein
MTVVTGGPLTEAGQSPTSIALHVAKSATALALEIGRRWLSQDKPAGPAANMRGATPGINHVIDVVSGQTILASPPGRAVPDDLGSHGHRARATPAPRPSRWPMRTACHS